MKKKWSFDESRNGFVYEDDPFRFTSEPDYARGQHVRRGGYEDGALSVTLGGVDDLRIKGMSGGWTREFGLDETEIVTLVFRYKINQSGDYKRGEVTDVRVALDGDGVRHKGEPYVFRIEGDGFGGEPVGGGWRKARIELGPVEAGRHELTIGAFSDQKSVETARSRILFDDVTLTGVARDKPVKLGKFEAQVLERTNDFREKHGLDPVKAEKNLTRAAEDWSRDMARGDFYRHSSLPDQFEQFGYDAANYGENIAAGYPTPKAVVNGWIDSPGHRKNLLDEDVEHLGVGYFRQKNDGGDVAYTHYWTQIFGDPSSDYLG